MTIVILHFGLDIEYIIVRRMLIIYIYIYIYIYIIKIIFAKEIKNKYLIIMLSKNPTIYTINHYAYNNNNNNNNNNKHTKCYTTIYY
jgi:hypothetical protein